MNITYTGKQERLHPKQQANIDAKFGKIAKLLDIDRKGGKQAHVILAHHKNQHRAEITLNYLDHALVGEHTDADQFTAINMALEKLEKRIMKVREKRRDTKKGPREGWDKGASANTIIAAEPTNPEALPAANNGRPKVFRVAPADSKPMTLEEALLVIENDDYLVYREKNNRLAVLLRRNDGNFDLVEC
jgi:putative sigma-54 modulation protein